MQGDKNGQRAHRLGPTDDKKAGERMASVNFHLSRSEYSTLRFNGRMKLDEVH